jgi:dihydroxyacetone kinase-like predicted kinase
VREASIGGFTTRRGEFLGLAGEHAVAVGPSFDDVARAVAEHLLAEPRDVLTLLTGENAEQVDGLVEELAERHPELEIEVHEGGQPHYPLLLSAE